MERIQAAISKAREARERQHGSMPPGAAPATPDHRAPEAPRRAGAADAVRAAWTELPQITPSRKLLARNRIVASDGGIEATPFDIIRTRSLQQMRAKGWKRLAITSPSAGCGKSTLCLNLALSMTRQPEVSVVLVEVDMRRPSLVNLLRIPQRHSVASVLTGTGAIADNAVRFGENLAMFTTQGKTRNPSDILNADSVGHALAEIEAIYAPTVMLFDMPPLLVNDDALAFLKHVDCALLVAAAETTTIQEVDTCERELAAHTNVQGVVLNKCRYMGKDYGGDYY